MNTRQAGRRMRYGRAAHRALPFTAWPSDDAGELDQVLDTTTPVPGQPHEIEPQDEWQRAIRELVEPHLKAAP